ncbi:MAG: TolC family protein [Gemmatimonadota bacterium]|nr:TolC family protein [Gemmatimonadota bacterium]
MMGISRWYTATTAAVALLAPAGLRAQAPVGQDPVLARLTAEAWSAAPAVLRSEALAGAMARRVRPAGALPDPMLSVGIMDLTLPRFAFRESDFTEVDIEVTQQFPWPGSRRAATGGARARARGAAAETASLRRALVVRVAELYYRLRYVVTAQQLLAKQRTLWSSTVEIADARYGTGSVPQGDPLQARIGLARLITEQAALGSEETGLRGELRALRGIRGVDTVPVAPLAPDSVAALLATAVDAGAHLGAADSLPGHPRLSARRAATEAADATVREAALAGRPDFELTVRYGARPLGADFFSAFAGIRVPLWAGRKQRLLTQAAQLEATAARQELAAEAAALTSELERTRAEARAGAVQLRLLVSSVLPLTREGVGAAVRDYRTGQAAFLGVYTAVDTHYRAELEAAEVAARHLTHLVMLEQLLEPEDTP